MNCAGHLKQRLLENAKAMAKDAGIGGEARKTAFVFSDIEMSFHPKSYENIRINPGWAKRLGKRHTAFGKGVYEMQSSNSSDALLMNIFCHPKFMKWKGSRKLLRIEGGEKDITFGWNPDFENEQGHNTEVDLKIGDRIFEAKLTESSFTNRPAARVSSYLDFNDVFDQDELVHDDQISNYQLVRNVLAAKKHSFTFTVLLDSSRIDLIRHIMSVNRAIRPEHSAQRFDFITWQELTNKLGGDLKEYIRKKYF